MNRLVHQRIYCSVSFDCCGIVHAQRVQLQHPEVTVIFDIDQTAAAATRHQLAAYVIFSVPGSLAQGGGWV